MVGGGAETGSGNPGTAGQAAGAARGERRAWTDAGRRSGVAAYHGLDDATRFLEIDCWDPIQSDLRTGGSSPV